MRLRANPKAGPIIILLGGILAVSTAAILIRYAQEEVSSLVIAAYRLTIASFLLTPIVWVRNRKEMVSLTRRQIAWGIGAGLLLAIHFAVWITSLELTSVASSVVLVTTTPLWVALFSPIFLKESVDKTVWLGLAVALLGGVTIGFSEICSVGWGGIDCKMGMDVFDSKNLPGNLLALTGAFCAAGYLMIGRNLRANLSTVPYIYLVYSISAAFLLLFMLISKQPMFGFSPQIYLWFLGLAIIPQLLGHTAFNWSLKYLPAAYVAVALLGEPIGSTIFAYFLLREIPRTMEIAGGVLILVGISLASLQKSHQSRAGTTSG